MYILCKNGINDDPATGTYKGYNLAYCNSHHAGEQDDLPVQVVYLIASRSSEHVYAPVGGAEPGLGLSVGQPDFGHAAERLHPLDGRRVRELHERLVAVGDHGHLERVGPVGVLLVVAHPVPRGHEHGRGGEPALVSRVEPGHLAVGVGQSPRVPVLAVIHLSAAAQVHVGVERGQSGVVERERHVEERRHLVVERHQSIAVHLYITRIYHRHYYIDHLSGDSWTLLTKVIIRIYSEVAKKYILLHINLIPNRIIYL